VSSAAAVSLLAVAFLLVPASPTRAMGHGGGHGFHGHAVSHGGGFHGGFHGHPGFHSHGVIVVSPFGASSIISVSPHFVSTHQGMRSRVRVPHGFVRRPFFGWGPGGGWVDPDEVVVIPQVADADPVPSEAPVPDPKFMSPPTPSPSSPPGAHTVIVQRGSKIEVQSFPTAR
jgi:hypothetical protein